MNNTFNWKRFGNLLNYDFRTNFNRGIIFMLLGAGLVLFIWIFCAIFGIKESPSEVRWSFLIIGAVAASVITPSAVYGYVNKPRQGIPFAMLPASHAEKYTSMLLYTLILYPLLSLVGGMVMDSLLWLIHIGPFKTTLFQSQVFDIFTALSEMNREFYGSAVLFVLMVVGSYLFNHAAFFYTNTLFKKLKFLWTILILYALQMIGSFVTIAFLGTHDDWFTQWFSGMEDYQGVNIVFGSIAAANLVGALVLYVLAFIRLKKVKY